ncbi:MAG: hypothetical protein KDH96_10185, partial [Candidatus Riesia sp.]|nr:hypothetical protein [Candidatus Riesia sp.]
ATLLGDSFKFLENVDFSTPKTVIISIFTKTFESINATIGEKFVLFTQNVFGDNSTQVFDTLARVLGIVSNAFIQLNNNLRTNGLYESFQNLITQIIYASTEIFKLAGPAIGALAGAITVLTVAFIPKIADVLKLIIDTVADIIQNIGDVARVIREFITGQRSFKDTIISIFSEIFQTIGTIFVAFDRLGDIIASTIKDAISIVGNLLGIDVQPFLENFGWIIDIIGDLIATGLAAWVGILGKAFNILRGTLGLILKPFKLVFSTIELLVTKYKALQTIMATLKVFFSALGNIVSKVASIFTTQNPIFNALGKTFNFITNQTIRLFNALGGFQAIFSILTKVFTAFFTFASSSFRNLNIVILGAVAAGNVLKFGLSESIQFVIDKFAQFRDFLFGDDGLISKISAIGTTVTDPFASLVITNPFAFIDEFLPIFKIAIEGVPTYFTGLLDDVVVFNPFEALNTFLFGEEGFTSRVLGIGSNFVTTASEITGINIPDPFLAIKTTLDNIESIGPLAKESVTLLVDALKDLTINDVFEAISNSLDALLTGAKNLLELDLSGFSKVFAPVTEQIDSIKQQFDDLVKKFKETASLIPGINLGESELTGVEVAQEKIKTTFGDKPVTVDQKLDLLLEDPELSDKAK